MGLSFLGATVGPYPFVDAMDTLLGSLAVFSSSMVLPYVALIVSLSDLTQRRQSNIREPPEASGITAKPPGNRASHQRIPGCTRSNAEATPIPIPSVSKSLLPGS